MTKLNALHKELNYYTDSACDNSQLVTVYVALTEQSSANQGAVDFYLCSNLPMSCGATLLNKWETRENFFYFHKVQPLLKKQDSVAWWGTTLHSVHGNKSQTDRINLFYVLEIKEPTWATYNLHMDLKCTQRGHLTNNDYNYYCQGFDWITDDETYTAWKNRQIIHQTIRIIHTK